jgi:Domain of unkown function (DUF1775)
VNGRRAWTVAWLAAALGLVWAQVAAAHVTVVPASVEVGATGFVQLVTPNERPGHTTVRVTVDVPKELEIVSARAPAGWIVERTTRTATWSDGSIAGTDTVQFPLELRGLGPAGAVELSARQRYEDGADVDWQAALTVLPATGALAPPSHGERAVIAGVVGLVLVAGGLAVLHLLRRQPREGT